MNNGISFMYAHNRGYTYLNCMSKKDSTLSINGAAMEVIEDSIKDIDIWVKKIKELGYKEIYLMGHSLGCNKALHYLNNTKHKFKALILASPPDMVALTKEDKNYQIMLEEAELLLKNNKPKELLHHKLGDTDYISAQTFINLYTNNTPADNFPIARNPQVFTELANVDIPIFAFSGSLEHPLFLKLDLLKEKAIKAPLFKYKIIDNANHFYFNKEDITCEYLLEFIQKY